ncbi:MAG: S8 family serine peptidase [Elusimicrobia bacterium]|nr:S8 family serine peptidase [Elusimicrobiota bacterium]
MRKFKTLLSLGLAASLLALNLQAVPAAAQLKPATPAPSEQDKAAAELSAKRIMSLQDYGLPPGLYFQNPEDLNGGEAFVELYRFPLKVTAPASSEPSMEDLIKQLLGSGPKKDGQNPTKIGVALLELLDRTPAATVAKITNKKLGALLVALRDYAARQDDPLYLANPALLAGYKSRVDEIMAKDVAGDTDYAGLGKQGRSLRAVLKDKQDALRAAMAAMQNCKGQGCPRSIPEFVKQVDGEMTTLQIGADGRPLVPSTLVQLVKAIPEKELSQQQWRTLFTSYPMGQSLWQQRVDKLWRQKLDGKGVTVAILDVGMDKDHPYLKGQVTDGLDGSVITQDKYVDPKDKATFGKPNYTGEHGTHVASTVLAYAPKVKIINIKVLDEEKPALERIPKELRRDEMMTTQAIADGLKSVYDHNQAVAEGKLKGDRIDIVSMSLGIPESNTKVLDPRNLDQLSSWVKKLSEQGVVVVVAAGNEGAETARKPGFAPEAITVGAVDYFNQIADFSSSQDVINTGTGKTDPKPDVFAYGVAINAAAFDGKGYAGKTNEQLAEQMSGTSMATPHATAVTALLLQKAKESGVQLTPDQVKKILQASSDPVANGNPYLRSSGGVIDPNKAVEYFQAHLDAIKKKQF